MAVAAQLMQQIRRAHQAGLQSGSGSDDLRRQRIGQFLGMIRQVKMQRQQFFCLCIQPMPETFDKCSPDPPVQRLIFADIPAQHCACADHDIHRIGVERAADEVVIAEPAFGKLDGSGLVILRFVQCQPVAVSPASGP